MKLGLFSKPLLGEAKRVAALSYGLAELDAGISFHFLMIVRDIL